MNISGNKLKEIRLKHRLKQYQMADMLGITASYISKLEKAETFPISENLTRSICSTFNVNRDYILTGEDSLSIAETPVPYFNNDSGLFKQVREILDAGSPYAEMLKSQIIATHNMMKTQKELDKMKEMTKKTG